MSRDTVLVLNRRFVPDRTDAPYIYGVVQHALRVAEILRSRGARVGFVLYRRTEGLEAPALRAERILGDLPGVTVDFHYGMAPSEVTAAFRTAVHTLTAAGPAPLVYYQTSALLPYAPPEFDSMVTHHAPFVRDVVDAIGLPLTQQAFEWDHQKAEHLSQVQNLGLDIVRGSSEIVCAEISPIQVSRLEREAVPAGQVIALPQPLESCAEPVPLPSPLDRLGMDGGLTAITAVSRLDQFKNVELFVQGCCQAIGNGDVGTAAVIGGFPDDAERNRLRDLVPTRFLNSFLFLPRINHDALTTLFRRLAGKAVFACSSRFDLVPYTALEAARAGLCTIVPDLRSVGASKYLPERFRFPPVADGMATSLKRLAREAGALRAFEPTAAAIRRATSDEAFLAAFDSVCARFQDRTPGR